MTLFRNTFAFTFKKEEKEEESYVKSAEVGAWIEENNLGITTTKLASVVDNWVKQRNRIYLQHVENKKMIPDDDCFGFDDKFEYKIERKIKKENKKQHRSWFGLDFHYSIANKE
jgi:hypothetical protein